MAGPPPYGERAAQLRAARGYADLPLKETAKLFEVSVRQLGRIEDGEADPPRDYLRTLLQRAGRPSGFQVTLGVEDIDSLARLIERVDALEQGLSSLRGDAKPEAPPGVLGPEAEGSATSAGSPKRKPRRKAEGQQ